MPIEKFKTEFLSNPDAMINPVSKRVPPLSPAEIEARRQEKIASEVPKAAPKLEQQSRVSATNLEPLFKGLDPVLSDAKTRMQTKEQIATHPLADRIKYVEDNFYDMLMQLDSSGKVKIKC